MTVKINDIIENSHLPVRRGRPTQLEQLRAAVERKYKLSAEQLKRDRIKELEAIDIVCGLLPKADK